ncbi:DEP domain-containing protein 4-like [Scleropages formosus]|uniref:DEP domain-containing protein 4-like n=1 Tax=Scleropages formosus TaxID=113540 RepID=A0A0N8JZM9_SCLFO|nr:DEP domain-containing protein 4-like [Scleropages formosus]
MALWKNIIHALQTQVDVRRRRQHLRVHDNCFTGSDAVDAVLSHLMQNVYFSSSEISRLKATRLCQALMEAKVFEPVGTRLFRREKDITFEDSSCSLYRFLDCAAMPGSERKYSEVENEIPDSREKIKNKRHHPRIFSNPLALEASERRVERLLRTLNLRPTMPSSQHAAPPAVVEGVWKQHTLLQLLQIVELPVLDSILTSPGKPEPQRGVPLSNHEDLVISNTFVDREVIQSLNLPQLDSWLTAATTCLEHFPDQLIVVAGEHLLQQGGVVVDGDEELSATKRLLFDIIAKYYGAQERRPLIIGRYLDIHMGILELLVEGKQEPALTASQLCLRLMEPSDRDELRRLLAFMAVAAHPEACRLHKQLDNRTLVSRTFLKAILDSKGLNRTQNEQLVLFLVDNHAQLFKTPALLIKAVSKTLQTLQQGRDLDAVPMFTFCQRVTVRQYEDQRDKATLESLRQLICDISLNTTLPIKEKRRLVKDFQKHHPVVFLQHFSNTF